MGGGNLSKPTESHSLDFNGRSNWHQMPISLFTTLQDSFPCFNSASLEDLTEWKACLRSNLPEFDQDTQKPSFCLLAIQSWAGLSALDLNIQPQSCDIQMRLWSSRPEANGWITFSAYSLIPQSPVSDQIIWLQRVEAETYLKVPGFWPMRNGVWLPFSWVFLLLG